jgi:hypothetical protein
VTYPAIETGFHTDDCPHCLEDYVASYGGPALVDQWRAIQTDQGPSPLREELFCERLAHQGWDYSILVPTNALAALCLADLGKRQTLQRAINHYHADRWHRHRAQVTPAAGIPLHTPRAGIAQLEFAVKRLRLKAITISGSNPGDGEQDYDPFWAKVVELGVPVLLDCAGEALQPFARALLSGRVTRRFPQLRVGLLDGWGRHQPEIAPGASFYYGLDPAELGGRIATNDNAFCASRDGRLIAAGTLPEEARRAYLFTNPYRLYTDANADFFSGTSVEAKLAARAV